MRYPAFDHSRSRRSVVDDDGSHKVQISFGSHGRNFDLELKRDLSVFPDSVVIEDYDGRRLQHLESKAHHHIYEGLLSGEPESHVFGSVRDGIFDGQIHTQSDGVFFVERAQKYFQGGSNDTFHSVIYHEDHLKDPYRHSRHGESELLMH